MKGWQQAVDKVIDIQDNIIKFFDASGKDVEAESVSASDVSAIHIDNCTVSKFFKKIDTKRIRITATGIDKPLEVYENKVGAEAFKEYADALVDYAKKFHIAYRTPEE